MRRRLFHQPNCNYSEKDASIKLALDSKLLNDQIFKNKYQMPNIHELIDNVALQISEKSNRRVWFSNLDLKNASSHFKQCEQTSKWCIFSIVGVENTGTYRFLTGFYGLGDKPNEFQRVINSLLKIIPLTNCYTDEILVASRGSLEEHKATVYKILSILDKNKMAVKWGNCAFFKSEIEWLGFRISGNGVRPLVGKADAIKKRANHQGCLRTTLVLRLDKSVCKICSEFIDSKLPSSSSTE